MTIRHDPDATTMICREYVGEDWHRICEIYDLARPKELEGSCDPRAFIPIRDDTEVEGLKLCKKLVACADESIGGFVGFSADHLAWLYVDPAFQGRGIGRALMEAALQRIGGQSAWTVVLEGNHPARRLYDSLGFKLVERFEGNNAGYPCIGLRLSRQEINT